MAHPRYTIPIGTKVDVTNLVTGEKRAGHITKTKLQFEERANTTVSYGTLYFYFRKGNWLIAVPEKCVH